MTSDEMFAKHGLVLVRAEDVRRMMDYYQRADFENKTTEGNECYDRLWVKINSVELDSV